MKKEEFKQQLIKELAVKILDKKDISVQTVEIAAELVNSFATALTEKAFEDK